MHSEGQQSRLSRRRMVQRMLSVGLAAAAPPLLAACGGAASGTLTASSSASGGAPSTAATGATTGTGAATTATAAASASVASASASSTVAASASGSKAALAGTFTYLGWGDIAYNQAMLDAYKQAFPDKVGDLKFQAQGVKGEADVLTKVLAAFAAKTDVPDIFQQNAPTVPQLLDQGILAPLDQLITPHKDAFSPSLLDALSANGHPYAFPWRPNTLMLFYRRDLLQNAGIDPASLTSWDAYMAAGKTYAGKTQGKSYFTYLPTNNSNGNPIENFMDGLGLSFYGPGGKPTAGNDAKMLQALQSYEQFLTTKTAEPHSEWDAPWYAAIKNGEFATLLSAVWMDNTLKGQAPELRGKWGIMAMPGYSADQPTHGFQQGSPVLLVSSTTKFADLAQNILGYQYFDQSRVLQVAKQRADAKQGIFPPLLKEVLTDPLYSTPDPYYDGQKFFDLNSQLAANAFTMRFTKDFAQTLKIYDTHLDAMSAGKETAQQADDGIAKDIAAKIGTSS